MAMPEPIKPPLPRRTLAFARQLRQQGTDAERRLWYRLRAKRFQAVKWRRQHPLPPYIVDFYCHATRLVVELDGGRHTTRSDAARTACLESQGFRVLRFWNDQVLVETEAVLDVIYRASQDLPSPLTPLPVGEGDGTQAFPA